MLASDAIAKFQHTPFTKANFHLIAFLSCVHAEFTQPFCESARIYTLVPYLCGFAGIYCRKPRHPRKVTIALSIVFS